MLNLGEVAEVFGVTRSTISEHIQKWEAAGLLHSVWVQGAKGGGRWHYPDWEIHAIKATTGKSPYLPDPPSEEVAA